MLETKREWFEKRYGSVGGNLTLGRFRIGPNAHKAFDHIKWLLRNSKYLNGDVHVSPSGFGIDRYCIEVEIDGGSESGCLFVMSLGQDSTDRINPYDKMLNIQLPKHDNGDPSKMIPIFNIINNSGIISKNEYDRVLHYFLDVYEELKGAYEIDEYMGLIIKKGYKINNYDLYMHKHFPVNESTEKRFREIVDEAKRRVEERFIPPEEICKSTEEVKKIKAEYVDKIPKYVGLHAKNSMTCCACGKISYDVVYLKMERFTLPEEADIDGDLGESCARCLQIFCNDCIHEIGKISFNQENSKAGNKLANSISCLYFGG